MWTILGFKIEVLYINQNCGALSQVSFHVAMWNFLLRTPLQHINNAKAKKIQTDCLDASDI